LQQKAPRQGKAGFFVITKICVEFFKKSLDLLGKKVYAIKNYFMPVLQRFVRKQLKYAFFQGYMYSYGTDHCLAPQNSHTQTDRRMFEILFSFTENPSSEQ